MTHPPTTRPTKLRGNAAGQATPPSASTEALLAEVESLRARLHELELALNHQERLASLGTVTALIAHEFNNILTPIMSYAQMALARPEDAGLARRALERAAEGAERAGKISTAILGLARQTPEEAAAAFGDAESDADDGGGGGVPRGTPPPSAAGVAEGGTGEWTEVGPALERALACLGRDLEKDGIGFRVEVPAGLRVAISSVALEHVLLNLVLNARKAILARGAERSGGAGGVFHVEHPPVVDHSTGLGGMGARAGAGGRRAVGTICVVARRASAGADGEAGAGRCDGSGSTQRQASHVVIEERDGGGWWHIEVSDDGVGMTRSQVGRMMRGFYTTERGEAPAGGDGDSGDGGSGDGGGGDEGVGDRHVAAAAREAGCAEGGSGGGSGGGVRKDEGAEWGGCGGEEPPRGRRGTGLGMVVCRRLVEGAGGTIAVESARGVGTRVRVRVWGSCESPAQEGDRGE